MTTKLTTEWLRIGRSGATVDGRDISPVSLTQAAESYNPELYTALIWLEHQRFGGHLGKVLALKSANNDEGGVDLFAQLQPNRNYLAENSIYDEGWFTSMELTPDFRKMGKWYLTGLGATNEPASVATTEIRFSKQAAKENIFFSQYTQTETQQFTDEREKGLFEVLKQFFSSQEQSPNESDDMTEAQKQQLANFQKGLDEVKKQLASFSVKPPDNADIEAFKAENAELKTKVEAFEAKEAEQATKFAALTDKVAALELSLNDALKEVDGTPPPKHNGGGTDIDKTLA